MRLKVGPGGSLARLPARPARRPPAGERPVSVPSADGHVSDVCRPARACRRGAAGSVRAVSEGQAALSRLPAPRALPSGLRGAGPLLRPRPSPGMPAQRLVAGAAAIQPGPPRTARRGHAVAEPTPGADLPRGQSRAAAGPASGEGHTDSVPQAAAGAESFFRTPIFRPSFLLDARSSGAHDGLVVGRGARATRGGGTRDADRDVPDR